MINEIVRTYNAGSCAAWYGMSIRHHLLSIRWLEAVACTP